MAKWLFGPLNFGKRLKSSRIAWRTGECSALWSASVLSNTTLLRCMKFCRPGQEAYPIQTGVDFKFADARKLRHVAYMTSKIVRMPRIQILGLAFVRHQIRTMRFATRRLKGRFGHCKRANEHRLMGGFRVRERGKFGA